MNCNICIYWTPESGCDHMAGNYGEIIPNETTYQLTNGQTLQVLEEDGEGMAGEPTTFIWLSIEKELKRFDEVAPLMAAIDAEELSAWLNRTGEENASNARAWTE